jgi:hypothetical protein
MIRSSKCKCLCSFLAVWATASLLPYTAQALGEQGLTENVRGKITRDALKDVLAPVSLQAVIKADESQDKPGSEGVAEIRRHFDGSALPAAAAYMMREQSRAVTLACEADTDPESRAEALRHLGLMLHSAQDFYLHTNYLELQLEDPRNLSDVYNLPLADWNKVPDGYSSARTGLKLVGYDTFRSNDLINKDSATTAGGKQIAGRSGVALFDIACDLATRETKHQWSLFEVLVRTRCGSRAPAVLDALRNGDVKESVTPKQGAEHGDR